MTRTTDRPAPAWRLRATRILDPGSAAPATAWYTVLAAVMTWPLVAHLDSGVPQNLGDPLLNVWILGWDASHLCRFLGGQWHALSGFWSANIFYPEPLTLAYSEHLLGQAVQILPIYAVTGNLILCYNVLLLSTFVLSGLGGFLLVRELTGNRRAAFLAGLLYAFALFRGQHLTHLQVLSSQWMPFVLFGLRRYFVTRRWPALAGASAALVAQNLSCGYYLMFFDPFVAAYVLYEMWMRRAWRDGRVWLSFGVAGAGVVVATVPFFLPYLELAARGLGRRQPGNLDLFGADVYSYLTAYPGLRLWGPVLQVYPKLEAFLFPGLVPVALALVGIAATGRRAWRAGAGLVAQHDDWLVKALWVLSATSALGGIAVLFAGRRMVPIAFAAPAAADPFSNFVVAVLGVVGALTLSPRARAMCGARDGHSSAGFYAVAAAAAIWLSFGSVVRAAGYRVSYATLYGWLYEHVPGFDGLRVPSRYAMLTSLFLAVLAGFGADAIGRARGVAGRVALLVVGAAFLAEAAFAPLQLFAVWPRSDSRLPAAMGSGAEQVYRYVRALPEPAILVEFPINDEQLSDNLYMYASTGHWHRLVNGRSGWYPRGYAEMARVLEGARQDPEAAWRTLVKSGATYAVVHEGLYLAGEGPAMTQWLRDGGARELYSRGGDRLFALPR